MATKYWMISNRSVDGNRLSGDPGKTHYWISDSEELDQLGKATLAEHELDDPFGSTLVKDIAACRKRLGKAGDFTTDVREATKAEAEAKSVLVNAIRVIQSAAKEKYARSAPLKLKDYFVGEDLDSSRAMLTQIADSLLEKSEDDTLPGVNGKKTKALSDAREAYEAAHNDQTDAQSKATRERTGIEADLKSVTDRRVQIQFAADGEWPVDGNGNSAVRREFKLHPTRLLPR